jgi:PleD family two-component response regulator
MSQPTILVINDVDEMAELIATLLNVFGGYRTLTAYDGKTAIALAISNRPELILVDNIMPNPDGYEVCRAVRANPLTSAIPIIMTLHSGMPNFESRGLEVGVDGFLYYPIAEDPLIDQVKAVLARGRSGDQ